MSYRRNQYDSNRDDDRYSKPYSKRNNYQPREETAYVAKEYSKKNIDQADNTYYDRNGHTEYVAKPKKEVNNNTNHDNVIKQESNQTQEIYVPKNVQRKSGEGSTLAADNIAKEGHEERKTQQREKKPKREPQEHRGKQENNNTQEMYVPKKGQRKSGEGSALAADNVNKEGQEERKTQQREKKPKREPQEHRIKEENGHPQEMYVPKKGQRKSGEGSNLVAGDIHNQAPRAPKKDHKKGSDSNGQVPGENQSQVPKNKKEGHEGQKGQNTEKKPKREPHEQDVKEEKGYRLPKQKPAKDSNQAAPDNQKQEGSKIERNSNKTVERDTYQYDENLIAEITSMLHQAALEIPEPVFEKPKEENKAPVVEQNQAQELKSLEENKGDKVEAEKKEEPKNKSPEKAKPNQQKEQPPKKERIKALDWISKEFYGIYHKKRNFLDLYKQLEKFWEEVHETFEDEQATYKCFAKIKPNFINSFAVYVMLLFHVLTEKQLLEEAVDWFYQHKKFVEKEDQFGPIIFDAVQELEQKYVKSNKNGIVRRVQKKILDAVNLADFGRKIEDVNVVDKFDKSGKRFIRVGALEKIKKEDKIAVHFERNEHLREYMATIQIATRNEVFILDFERICKFEDNLLALVEFFTFIFSRRSTVVIVMDAKELCQGIIDTMFMEKEKDNKDFVEKKRELCQVLGRYENHFTDLSKVGVGKNIREVFQNVLDVKLDQRQRYGDWYWRPLTEDQINTAAIEASGLFACYDKLFEENLGAEAQP